MRHLSAIILLLAFAAGLGFKVLRGNPQQSAATTAANPVTVLVWMGVKASSVEDWSGSAAVSGGSLLAVEGRHFSEGDAVQAGNQWQAKTRVDAVAPYADIHYTEMRPGSTPEVRHQPVGVYLRLDAPSTARIALQTRQGNFEVALADLKLQPLSVLQGKALVMRVPSETKLSDGTYEDDEPSIAMLPDGGVAVAWVAYRGEADRVLLKMRAANGAWSAAQEVTGKPGDLFKTSLAATPDRALWVFWSEREQQQWILWGRQWKGGTWSKAERVSGEGSATFHRAAASRNGAVHVVWQSFRGTNSDIALRSWQNGSWQNEVRVSESAANDWEPAVAGGADGTAHVAWDSYDKGNYDIHYRTVKEGRASEIFRVTDGPRFQAHVSIAVDSQGRPWLAWNESGISWGKDQGFLIPTPLATPLHQERWLKVVMRDGNQWQEAWPLVEESLPVAMRRNAEHPQLVFSPGGALTLVFRHWTRRQSRSIGSLMVWENYATVYNGQTWTAPQPFANSGSWIEKLPALASDGANVWAAWMSDNRSFADLRPVNADIYAAKLEDPGPLPGEVLKRAYVDSAEEVIPVHTNDAEDVKAIRAAVIESGGRKYRIFRGDMHRHTDISQDFKYDGSLFEVYRYALDAAGFDYIAPTDHQAGFDQEYSWWQNQKYVDLFLVPGNFVPLFGYERSLRYPNGHRNIIWSKRGVRTLPIPAEEAAGREGAKKLFAHLRETGGISMPHSSATDQGTDWRDNDPQVEPLMEIYQGYRASYEYEGAPRAATTLNQQAQKSGWQPAGFWWKALDKGYRLGVQASSDHWSTHISYACLLVEGTTREDLLTAIRKRHAYAATDNIILDFRARAGGKEFLMGDDFESTSAPVLVVNVTGTNAIKQVDIVRDKNFIYTTRPQTKNIGFSFTDSSKGPGQSWYYVRVLQEDGQLAWSSPIWVKQ